MCECDKPGVITRLNDNVKEAIEGQAELDTLVEAYESLCTMEDLGKMNWGPVLSQVDGPLLQRLARRFARASDSITQVRQEIEDQIQARQKTNSDGGKSGHP